MIYDTVPSLHVHFSGTWVAGSVRPPLVTPECLRRRQPFWRPLDKLPVSSASLFGSRGPRSPCSAPACLEAVGQDLLVQRQLFGRTLDKLYVSKASLFGGLLDKLSVSGDGLLGGFSTSFPFREFLNDCFRVDRVPEKQKDINKTCSVDLAGHFGTLYVLSPRRTALLSPFRCRD